jgi:hypothetical protein
MSRILNQLPYFDVVSSVLVQGEQVHVLPHQIIVWVSVSSKEVPRLGAAPMRIPAILDSGNTFGFSIAEQQLVQWCGIHPGTLAILGPILINGQSLNRHAADVWLHCNQRKQRDSFSTTPPYRLELRDGIALYPADARILRPRLPLLGLRAIDENALRCTINGKRLTVSVSTT